MTILDRAKAAAELARRQAEHGWEAGQAGLGRVQERRRHTKLLQQLGAAYHAEQRGGGTREAVVRAVAALDAHRQAHQPGVRGPGGTLAGRRARDVMHPGAECVAETDSLVTAAVRMRDPWGRCAADLWR